MKTNLTLSMAPLSVLAVFGSATTAAASGFSLNTQSAETLGAATAGAQATPGAPGNAYFNPASIVGVEGFETSFSAVLVVNDTNYSNANAALFGTVPVAGDVSGEAVIGDGVFPAASFAVKLNDYLYAGVATYAPFGFNSAYDDTSAARYHGTFSQVVSAAISPIVGVDLGNGWSVAAGPRFQYVDNEIRGAIDAAGIEAALLMNATVPGTDDVFYEINATDWGVGYTVGVHGSLGDNITVGASFASKIEHVTHGTAEFDITDSTSGQTLAGLAGLFATTDTTGTLSTPGSLQFGVKVDVNPKTRVLGSAVQTRWSNFQELVTSFENPAQVTEVITQDWQNTWAGAVGVERDFGPAQTLRLGVMYEEDPVNADFASPRLPGASRVWLAGGYSRKISDNAELHLAASYVISDTQPLNESGAYPENLFRGSYTGDWQIGSVVAAIGVDWKF